jgi:hypothetical protein
MSPAVLFPLTVLSVSVMLKPAIPPPPELPPAVLLPLTTPSPRACDGVGEDGYSRAAWRGRPGGVADEDGPPAEIIALLSMS